MIIALPTLLYIQDAIFSAIGRLVRPYYKSFSQTLKGQNDEEDDDQVFAEYDEEKGVVFYPPMYAQRYAAFSDCLMDERWAGQLEKIVDFGYNDMSFIRYIKEMPGVKTILGVDLDSIPLRCSSDLLGVSEYAPKRDTPVQVMLFQGNAADPDFRLIGTDAVVAIELIEHMLPHDLDRFVHTIFGFIKPRIALISTPNGDFNVLFKSLESNGFRRLDHFFEWSREQFHDWCINIVMRYPGYTVTCQGIGPGPEGTAHLGCCSQMALFVAKQYKKQMEFTYNSLALVAQSEQNYYYINSDSGDTDNSSQQQSSDLQILNCGPDILQRQTLTIYMSGPVYASYDDLLENCDQTSQCNLDNEFGKNYMMDGEDVATSAMSVIVPRRRDSYNVYEIGDIARRLNCTTLKARKFSKLTQNLMTKHKLDSLMHTKEVVNEIKSLARMLNFNPTSVAKTNSNIWNNINWADNAPYCNEYYKLVKDFSYPFEVVSDESRILDIITDEINRLVDEHFDEDYVGFTDNYHNKLEIPIEYLVRKVRHITSDDSKVREVLEWNGYDIVDNVVVYTRMISNETTLDEFSDDKDSQYNNNRQESNDLFSEPSCGSIRRAINFKIQKLLSTLTADEDICFEIDHVVCQLVKLTLRTSRHRNTPIPTQWLLVKLYDLLTLNIKAIEKKKMHFSPDYKRSQPTTDEISDNKSDATHTIDKSSVIETEETNSYITQIVENLANNALLCDNTDQHSDETISIPDRDIQLLVNIPEESLESQSSDDNLEVIPTVSESNLNIIKRPEQLDINQIDLNELNQHQTDSELLEYSAEFIDQPCDMLQGEVYNVVKDDLAKMTLVDLDPDQVQVLRELIECSVHCTKEIVPAKHTTHILNLRESDPKLSYQSFCLNEMELNSPAAEPYRIELSKLDLKQLDQYELELYRLEQSLENVFMPELNATENINYEKQAPIQDKMSDEQNIMITENDNSNFFEALKKYQEDNTALEIMKKYIDIFKSEAEIEDESDNGTKERTDYFSSLSSDVFSNGSDIGHQPVAEGLNIGEELCDDSGSNNICQHSESSISTDTINEPSQSKSVSSEHTSINDTFECEYNGWIYQNINNSGSTHCLSTDIHSIPVVDSQQNVAINQDDATKSKLFSKSAEKTDSDIWTKSQNAIVDSHKFVAIGIDIIADNVEINHNALDVDRIFKQDTARLFQSKVTKPIPGEITTYCQSNTETVQKNIEVSDIFSKEKCSKNQTNINLSDTKESMFIEIVTDNLCETISLRRSIGTDFDDIENISEQEVTNDEVLWESNLNTGCLHSADDFQTQRISYDLDQPSTSKCFRLVTNEVQCGPDIPQVLPLAKDYSYHPQKKDTETSMHNYDNCLFTPLSKSDKMATTCPVGIKIKDSNDNLQSISKKPQETAGNDQTLHELNNASQDIMNATISVERKIEPEQVASLSKSVSSQLVDLKVPLCENSKVYDLKNSLNCSLDSLAIKLPDTLNKETYWDSDSITNNEILLKLQRGSVYIQSYKNTNVLEDVVFQGKWQRHRTLSLSPDRYHSNISSKYVSETSVKKLRSSSTPICYKYQPKNGRGTSKPLKVDATKAISKEKVMKLPSNVVAKLHRLSGETKFLSDTTMKNANELKLTERSKMQSGKTIIISQTQRLVSFAKRPITLTTNVKTNHEVLKRPISALPKCHEVQKQGKPNENLKNKFVELEASKNKTLKKKSATKLSFVTSKASKDRVVVKKTTSKTSAEFKIKSNIQKKIQPTPSIKNQMKQFNMNLSDSFTNNELFPTLNKNNDQNKNQWQKSFDHNLNYLLYQTEMNLVNLTQKSTSLKKPSNRSAGKPLLSKPNKPSQSLQKSAQKSPSPISLILSLEKNEYGSPDCSSVNSVCTVKELSPRPSNTQDCIAMTPKKTLKESTKTKSKISKIPKLTKPIHKKVVDKIGIEYSNATTTPKLSKGSAVSKINHISKPTKSPVKTSTPFSTPRKNVIIAQVVTTDNSNTGFILHNKTAIEINIENVDNKVKIEQKLISPMNLEAASCSTPRGNAITIDSVPDDREHEDKLSGPNITTERRDIKSEGQEFTNKNNETLKKNSRKEKINHTLDSLVLCDTINLSGSLNSALMETANDEYGSKTTGSVMTGSESIADTMVTGTDTDVISFRSIPSDNEFSEAREFIENTIQYQDIFERRKQSPQPETLVTQVLRGLADTPDVCDRNDPINTVDSETGSVTAAAAARTTSNVASEGVVVSGRSSESYQLAMDSVVPEWLFNLMEQQNRASGGEHLMEDDDEEPLLRPNPPNLTNNVAAIDLNGNMVIEGLVGAAAGAGDGRGIYSEGSSGRGSSLSSSDNEDTSRPESEGPSEPSTYQSITADNHDASSSSTIHLGHSNFSGAFDDEPSQETETNSAYNQLLPYSSSGCDADVSSNDTDIQI